MGIRKTEWISPQEVLSYFSKSNPTLSYQFFVTENQAEDEVTALDKIKLEL